MPVIVISMVLVVVGFVTLMLGVLGVGEDPLQFVYVSIGACLVAAVFLVIGVVRGRPSKKPVVASGGDGGDASWSGASAWGDKDADTSASGPIKRDEEEDAAAAPAPSGGTPRVEVVTAEDAAGAERTGGDDEGFQPPAEDEPVVVPKRTAAERAAAEETGADAEEADDATAAVPATRRSTAKKATKKSTAKKSTAKKSSAKKATAKKAAAKKSTAKKATAKKSTARKSAADDAARVEESLGNVSGVGPAKRKALLAHFGSYDALADATPAQLQEVNGVSETLAERIRRAMR